MSTPVDRAKVLRLINEPERLRAEVEKARLGGWRLFKSLPGSHERIKARLFPEMKRAQTDSATAQGEQAREVTGAASFVDFVNTEVRSGRANPSVQPICREIAAIAGSEDSVYRLDGSALLFDRKTVANLIEHFASVTGDNVLALMEALDRAVADARKSAAERKRVGWRHGAVALLSASRPKLLELLLPDATPSVPAGATLGGNTTSPSPKQPAIGAHASTNASIERTLVLTRAIPSSELKTVLPWLDPDMQIRQQRTSDDETAQYRAVAKKGKASGNAVLVITLSTNDGRQASAEITATSGKVDWFNETGAPLPADWDSLAVQLQVFQR